MFVGIERKKEEPEHLFLLGTSDGMKVVIQPQPNYEVSITIHHHPCSKLASQKLYKQ